MDTDRKSYQITAAIAFFYAFGIGTWMVWGVDIGGWRYKVFGTVLFLLMGFANMVHVGYTLQNKGEKQYAYGYIPRILMFGVINILSLVFLWGLGYKWVFGYE